MSLKDFIHKRLSTYSVTSVISNMIKLQPNYEYEQIRISEAERNHYGEELTEMMKSFGKKLDDERFLWVILPQGMDLSKWTESESGKSCKDGSIQYEFNDFALYYYPKDMTYCLLIPWMFAESMIPQGAKVYLGNNEYKNY